MKLPDWKTRIIAKYAKFTAENIYCAAESFGNGVLNATQELLTVFVNEAFGIDFTTAINDDVSKKSANQCNCENKCECNCKYGGC